jgi:catechol-2,3-dioxygenase
MRVTEINHVALNATGKADEVHDFYESFVGLNDIPRTGAATLVNGFWPG